MERTPGYLDLTKFESTSGVEVILKPFWSGRVILPTGRLVSCDPFVGTQHPQELDVRFVAGEYDVILSVASNNSDSRVARATVLMSAANPVAWIAARPRKEGSVRPNDESTPYAYAVDSGTGCFTSPEAALEFNRGDYAQKLLAELEKNYVPTWHWACLSVGSEKNMAVFATGFGNGRYGAHVGLDDEGRACCVVTDFGVLDDWGVVGGAGGYARDP